MQERKKGGVGRKEKEERMNKKNIVRKTGQKPIRNSIKSSVTYFETFSKVVQAKPTKKKIA